MKVESEFKKKSSKLMIVFILAMIVVAFVLGGTYAWFRISLSTSTTNVIKSGNLDLRLNETATGNGDIRLEKEVPKSFRQGLQNKPYKFTLINNSTIDTDFEIRIEDFYVENDANITNEEKIDDNLIRYILIKNDDELIATNSKLLSTGRVIGVGTIAGKTGQNPTQIPYTLYMWIDSQAGDMHTTSEIMNKLFSARIRISAIQHNANNT